MRPCTYTSVSQSQDGNKDSSTSADLNNTMMTTVVLNGNDALNLLSEAAQREEREVNGARVPVPIEQHATNAASTPLSSNAYCFVRMGWLSALEINVALLCLILDKVYAERSNHYLLVTHEPVLTCMILVISSRYHTLPTIGGHSRRYLIHQRLWDHFQHLLIRLVLGLEKYSKAKTRTLALYAPPPSDSWDSDILFTVKDRRDQDGSTVDSPSRTRWREDVIEPANRSDRMCWMVLSCVLPFGNELGIFDEQDKHNSANTRQRHTRRAWTPFLTAWTRLTKIVRSISDLLFPNPTTTSQIIRSGRYISMTEHIQTLLTACLLVLEYESTRMHTYSLGLQAILFRTLAKLSSAVLVINSTLNTLKIAIKLYDLSFLRFCTIRTFLHITTASIFLLKGLGLGVSPARLQGALEVLTQVIVALKNSNPDDLYLGGCYSMLLEMHMKRLQEHFMPSTRPHNITPPNFDLSRFPGLAASLEANHFELVDFQQVPEIDTSDANWLSLPLDSSLMSFGIDNFQGLQCLGDDTLDFIWNLGM
ncbi:hypothetical protein CC77DRAFT_1028111 [Alternaria alternata]|uniref:Transcription factor domain-containing protein n=1 Tax=Alternaria alternata TaxID=5599 RepID=A0A177DYC7_ALTAL|nr:hypothetical protein CC77DRAFT_1028111 [Alternaria alternata]OAG24181.1 hypothetical protein CC77DRAFT_1028111 [Alternaria alternata]